MNLKDPAMVLSWTATTVASSSPRTTGANPVRPRVSSAATPAKLPESHSRFLHVTEQGTTLRRAGSRLLLTRKQDVLLDVPASKLQGVLVYGNVQVSSHCFRNLLDQGCWLSFLTRNGIYKGRLQPPCERGGKLRRLQYECARDDAFSLDFAKAVIRGKILAAKQVLAAYASNYLAATLGESHRLLSKSLDRLIRAETLDELRGIEGAAARAYFDLFRRCNHSEIPFEGRVKRGASDPINCMLNFGYTLLTRELEGLIESAGLDPAVGSYHAPDGDRPSLACDWVEEFRHSVVDRLVLNLANRGSIQAASFEQVEGKGLRLKPEALRKFLTAYEQRLVGKPGNEESRATPYRNIFLRQLARLVDAIVHREPYRPHTDD